MRPVIVQPARVPRPTDTLAVDVAGALVLAGGTALVIAVADLRPAVVSVTGRVATELTVVFAMGGAALLLWSAERRARPSGRDAFVAALVAQCLVNVTFGVVPAIAGEPLDLDRTYYPWLAGRYVAGGLLLAAAARIRPGRVHTTLALAVATVVAFELLIAWADPVVPRTPADPGQATGPGAHWLLETPPLLMFAVGAYAAGRFAMASGEPLERWLSRALGVGVFTQVHEALYPAALGDVITSADLLRVVSAVLLLVGVVQQLLRWQTQRDRAVSLLRGDLRDSRESLVEAARARDREASFVGLMTHELAAPLAAISARTHVLQLLADDAQRPHVEELAAEADRLRDLLGRMDELRSLDDDSFEVLPRPVAVVPLLDEAAAFARGLPDHRPVLVNASPSPVLADPVRLGQVLRNVLMNATRYSPPGSPIRISGRVLADAYEVVVADEGPGVGGEDVEQLFEPGTRGSSASVGRAPGAGVGLHLCRRIMRAHGGDITFVDPDLPGARVRLQLAVA